MFDLSLYWIDHVRSTRFSLGVAVMFYNEHLLAFGWFADQQIPRQKNTKLLRSEVIANNDSNNLGFLNKLLYLII